MENIKIEKVNGEEIKTFTLTDGIIQVEIMNLGGTVRMIKVKDKNGNFVDVALGYKTAQEYLEKDGYIGATIGRVGNRIGGGKFVLNGKTYKVGINDNGNSLHGGVRGFDKKIWTVKEVSENSLTLETVSNDGEEGYPSELNVMVKYSVQNGEFKLEYFAKTDDVTILNLTNHTYFNLSGENSGDILDTIMQIDGDKITPVNEQLIPNGEFMDVKNTPFDFIKPKKVGKDIDACNEQIKFCGGYDINYVLNGSGFRKCVTAKSEKTGITMEVFTDNYGVQFYSGNFLDGANGKSGTKYQKRYGFCLETQNFPNAINCPNFPSPILRKGEKYQTTTVYKFTI